MLLTLLSYISLRRKKQFALLVLLMIVVASVEVISISAIAPFIGVLIDPDEVYKHQFSQSIIQILNLENSEQFSTILTAVFIISIIFSGLLRLLLLYISSRLSAGVGSDLTSNLYSRVLHQEYSAHLLFNSGELINSILFKTEAVVNGVITPFFALISSSVIVIGILSVLLLVDASTTLFSFACFGVFYYAVVWFTQMRIRKNSQLIARQSNVVIKSLQEGLNGIRDVIINASQRFFLKTHRDADYSVRLASANNNFISASPRYIIEMVVMVAIVSISYALTYKDGGILGYLPILSMFALGIQKMLPALQIVYGSYSAIKGTESSLQDVIDLLNLPNLDKGFDLLSASILFKDKIQLKQLSFSYSGQNNPIFSNIELTIKKGTCTGFIGVTGGGKSTLIDIIMGLLSPNSGKILVDGLSVISKSKESWFQHISHVSQDIYLSDSTIEENIAFGIFKENINKKLVKKVAKRAKISTEIENMKNGYQTLVGEHGARLSGGQRQRIGIARALYKQTAILVLDEATSALDSKTESFVMDEINKMDSNLTILIIAHRISTLKKCDQIVIVDGKGNIEISSYKDINS